MACVFGEMRTLKTSERAAAVSPKSVLFGEKEKNACTAWHCAARSVGESA